MCRLRSPNAPRLAVRIRHRSATPFDQAYTDWDPWCSTCVISVIPITKSTNSNASSHGINDEYQYARNPGGVSVRVRTTIIRIIAAVILFAAFTDLYVYSRSAYTNGLLAGYEAGETQGKLEGLVALQQWQYNHKCETTLNGFVSLKMWCDSENHYQFDCLVK